MFQLGSTLAPDISDKEFDAFRELIFREAGISLGDAKKTLVVSRLAKRLRLHKLENYQQYLDYLKNRDANGSELQEMVNCLTTNKTDFFREPHHFDFLKKQIIPAIEQHALHGQPKQLRIWSAACSTGEEPYTAAMTVLEGITNRYGWKIEILATDINTEVLKHARTGIYDLDRIDGLDPSIVRKYFLRGTGKFKGKCQVVSDVRNLVTFRQLNFMDTRWPIDGTFDLIFCRNVLIYFNAQTQQTLLPRLIQRMNPGGYLMLGHSENLPWLNDTLVALGNTMHQLPGQRSARKAGSLANGSNRLTQTPSIQGGQDHQDSVEPDPRERHELISGKVLATNKHVFIATTLGSCVAACIYDPVAKVGGMNHFMLPANEQNEKVCARYGNHAMEMLIQKVIKLGGEKSRLKAKVFGGARVAIPSERKPSVGAANSKFVRDYLKSHGIPLEAEKLDSEHPLRIMFVPTTGQVLLKRLPRMTQSPQD